MVLESILNPLKIREHPLEFSLIGFVTTIISFYLSFLVFLDGAPFLALILIMFGALPTLYVGLQNEHAMELYLKSEWGILKKHGQYITMIGSYFLGVFLAFALLVVINPVSVNEVMFEPQVKAVNGLNSDINGQITSKQKTSFILLNNMRVLLFTICFSFLYGAGAIFIITWNISTVGMATGAALLKNIAIFNSVGLSASNLPLMVGAVTHPFLRYMVHGVPELLGYFVGGLAGALISKAVIHDTLNNKETLLDIFNVVALAVVIIFVSAFIEVYVSQRLFML